MHIFYFVQFMQFPVLHFGLAHSGSRPFNSFFFCMSRGTDRQYAHTHFDRAWGSLPISLIFFLNSGSAMKVLVFSLANSFSSAPLTANGFVTVTGGREGGREGGGAMSKYYWLLPKKGQYHLKDHLYC